MRRAVATVGTFDGVHRGHLKLVRATVERARGRGLAAAALVFPKPPRAFFRPQLDAGLITTPEERRALLREAGLDRVVLLPFTRAVARMRAAQFLDEVLIGRLGAREVLVGKDFACGRDREGTVRVLRELGAARGVEVGAVPLVEEDELKVSSSHIRSLLARGEVGEASAHLGRPYALAGKVVRGRGIGRELGYPTANLATAPDKILPPGVFAARARVGASRKAWPAAVNIGARPTVSRGGRPTVEAHLLGRRGSLSGRTLTLELLEKLRDERRFPSLDALKAQIAADVDAASRRASP